MREVNSPAKSWRAGYAGAELYVFASSSSPRFVFLHCISRGKNSLRVQTRKKLFGKQKELSHVKAKLRTSKRRATLRGSRDVDQVRSFLVFGLSFRTTKLSKGAEEFTMKCVLCWLVIIIHKGFPPLGFGWKDY